MKTLRDHPHGEDEGEMLVPMDLPAAQEDPGDALQILLTDDYEGVRNFARTVLEGDGYGVVEAKNGAEALDVFKMKPDFFALLVTDRDMPVMDGETLVREIRKIRPQFLVVMMSGRERPADLDLQGFVKKPSGLVSELIHTVRMALGKVQ